MALGIQEHGITRGVGFDRLIRILERLVLNYELWGSFLRLLHITQTDFWISTRWQALQLPDL